MPKIKQKQEFITPDYILKLYKESNSIQDEEEKKSYIEDIKKLVDYMGESVTVEVEE